MSTVLDDPIMWGDAVAGVDAVHVPAAARGRLAAHLPVVIFDGDDTLWATEHLYDVARDAAAKVVADAGIDPSRWEELQRRLDVAYVERFGLSADRFPSSNQAAFVALAEQAGWTPTDEQLAAVRDAAGSVFDRVAPLMADAGDVVAELRDGYRLILLTQGDPRVQTKRITDSGLAGWFDEIVVVARKSPEVLAAIVDHFGIRHDEAWMVGNSVPSDINPAIAAVLRAIWIDAHVWEHGRREVHVGSDRVVVTAGLRHVPAIVAEHPM